MRIFVGGSLDMGHQERVMSKIAFFASCGRYRPIFQNFIYETKVIMSEYPQWFFIDIETDDLE